LSRSRSRSAMKRYTRPPRRSPSSTRESPPLVCWTFPCLSGPLWGEARGTARPSTYFPSVQWTPVLLSLVPIEQ
jgi:hypothetical protein